MPSAEPLKVPGTPIIINLLSLVSCLRLLNLLHEHEPLKQGIHNGGGYTNTRVRRKRHVQIQPHLCQAIPVQALGRSVPLEEGNVHERVVRHHTLDWPELPDEVLGEVVVCSWVLPCYDLSGEFLPHETASGNNHPQKKCSCNLPNSFIFLNQMILDVVHVPSQPKHHSNVQPRQQISHEYLHRSGFSVHPFGHLPAVDFGRQQSSLKIRPSWRLH
mmetsp:Transcript_42132/g.111024  ORF Transcript_42132/g.111024 Transcript_42132/m.111024 type:complete len:216 (+) Transcript_42132:1158-1805(+)